MLKIIFSIWCVFTMWACNGLNEKPGHKPNSTTYISDPGMQKTIFTNLVSFTDKAIPGGQLQDSLAFLVLPVKLSCPACRRKTIDSIVKHKNDLPPRHFIIISGSEGVRNMNSYFLEVDKEMPVMENQLFLDSTNQAYKKGLVIENPVIYYTANQKAYRKVSAIPSTVRGDLNEFFSGIKNVDLVKQ